MRLMQSLCMQLSIAAVLNAFAPGALAADDHDKQVFINPSELKWVNAPPTLPKGAKIAVVYGDPGKAGPFVLRLMAPAGYKVGPHWHSQTENLTVLSGTLYLGEGDKADRQKAQPLKTGGFHYLPARQHHYAYTRTPSIIQIHGEGPFDINYVNATDDPQRTGKK
ncbi:MAG TPA: cupin domain-containing protein [Casimicrobiaceae bacterium]|nr:cupin domain-containing protein [Casimicrobiaceae bacterium]